jgi:hypothetical protein
VRKSRVRTTKKITVFGVQRPQKPAPKEDVVPVKVVPLSSPRGLLEAPEPPPERERKYPRIDLSYLRRDRC